MYGTSTRTYIIHLEAIADAVPAFPTHIDVSLPAAITTVRHSVLCGHVPEEIFWAAVDARRIHSIA